MDTIIISVWLVQDEHVEHVLKLVLKLQEFSLKEEGNISYQVLKSKNKQNRLTLIEEYVSEDAILKHIESEHYKQIAVKQIHPFLITRTNDFQIKL
ncbi:putative quinol monooxygenase [Myroides sp. mNGS23_01]|nr:putative quinol monooxygenase [Myroides sp. mNGS23_01]WHT39383.1 putative quinol monooxygenase [Myroides sp. mNGS23_01]